MGGADEHRYEYCGDDHCPRWPCQVSKQDAEDGHRRGYDEGHAQGYQEGYEAGYKQGFGDGIDACPRPHAKGRPVMAGHILIAFAAIAGWLGSLYIKPFGRCPLCRGKGNLRRKHSRRARPPAMQGREAPPAPRLAHRPPHRPHSPRRAGAHPQAQGRQAMKGTWQTDDHAGGRTLAVLAIAAAILFGSAAAAIATAVLVALIALVVAVVLAAAGLGAWLVYRARHDRPIGLVPPPVVHQLPATAPRAIDAPGARQLHLHFHGVDAAGVVEILRRHQRPE